MKLAVTASLASVLLVGCQDETPEFASHAHGPHGGLVASFYGNRTTGHLEIKLHDDKGDLELWLGHDAKLERPFHIPLDTTPEIEFHDRNHRKIKLMIRDKIKNEGEDGTPHVTDGKTNYFIYPGATGEDSSWLKGKEFKSGVVVRFHLSGIEFESEPMKLYPHSH